MSDFDEVKQGYRGLSTQGKVMFWCILFLVGMTAINMTLTLVIYGKLFFQHLVS